MASSARNIVRCLKPNGLGTRPRSSIPLRVRTYYIRERNKQGRSSWRPWDLQSSYIWNLQCKARRCHESPSWEVKNEGEKIFPRFARTDRRYAPLCTASGSVSYTVPPPFINPVSAPVAYRNSDYTAVIAIMPWPECKKLVLKLTLVVEIWALLSRRGCHCSSALFDFRWQYRS